MERDDSAFKEDNKRLVLNSIIHPSVKNFFLEDIEKKREESVKYYFIEAALLLALKKQKERYDTVSGYNRYLRESFAKYPLVTVNSPDNTIPHILNISVKGVKGSVFQKALNEKGVCVSVKSACSTDNLPSRAVFAVSKNRKNALSSWRSSLSHMTTEEELHEFINIFNMCYNELTNNC